MEIPCIVTRVMFALDDEFASVRIHDVDRPFAEVQRFISVLAHFQYAVCTESAEYPDANPL